MLPDRHTDMTTTSDRLNKSDTTRDRSICLRGVSFKRLHVSAFHHLDHHQKGRNM